MAAPLPPVVVGPLYEHTKQAYVENVLPDAEVVVYENGVKVGEASSSSPGALWVPLTVGLTQGRKVTARQTYKTTAPALAGVTAGTPSEPSNEQIPVLPLPTPLPSPVFVSWVSTCTDSLYMEGLIPGCTLQVKWGTHVLVDALVTQTSQYFSLAPSPLITENAILEAQLHIGGHPPSPVTSSLPVALPEPLTAPKLSEPPLLDCQTAIAFSDMTPGADLRVINHGNETTALSSWDAWTLIEMTPLVDGPLTAQQYYTRCKEQRPGPVSKFTVERRPPPLPKVSYEPCTNVKQLTVTDLVPGEILTVRRVVQGQSPTVVGVQGVSRATVTVNLPPSFQATDPSGTVTLEISVTLCGVASSAPGYTKVHFAATIGSYPPPKLHTPLYDCARAVQVLDVHPGSLIQAFADPHGVARSQAVVATTSDPVLQLWSPLVMGERIYIEVSGCGAHGPSPSVPVKALPTPFKAPAINGAVVAGAASVDVTGVYQGAQVYLFVDNVFRSHVDSNQLSSFDEPVSIPSGTPPLKAGDKLNVMQTLCDQRSSVRDAGQGEGVVQKLYVRREIWGLEASTPFDPITLAYAEAVQVMQSRPITDPTSWEYQAAMHSTFKPPPSGADWNQCQHAGWFFLPWHRMYVYFFERIVRAAVEAAGGPNDFALPYWNYDRPAPGNTIPLAFRTPTLPNGTANPLYLPSPKRNASYMSGAQFDPSVTSPAVALADISFTSPSSGSMFSGFGGGKVGPIHFGANTGDLENTPHNVMHVEIGGASSGECEGGLMSVPECAALDPIFWLHHTNIDHLWNVWIASEGGRVDPSESSWLTAPFNFYDETGKKVTMTAAEVLDTATQLSYVYDDAPGAPKAMMARRTARERPEPSGPAELVAASERPLTLTGDPEAVQLSIHERTRGLVESAVSGPAQVIVSLDDIKAAVNPGVVYGVYLNLPAGADVDVRREYHVGNIALFGIEKMNDPDTRQDCAPGFPHVFDATSVASMLSERGQWDPSAVTVTFQTIGPLPPPGQQATWEPPPRATPVSPVEIGRVAIFVH